MTAPTAKAVLEGNFLFRDLPGPTIDKVASLATRRSYPEGCMIFSQGDSGDALYGLESPAGHEAKPHFPCLSSRVAQYCLELSRLLADLFGQRMRDLYCSGIDFEDLPVPRWHWQSLLVSPDPESERRSAACQF